MAAGTIIGRVSVKVLPDTSGFRQKAETELGKAEKGLTAKAEIELDDKGLGTQVKAAREKAQKQLKELTLQINLDNQQSLMRSIRQVQAELDKLDATELKVGLNRDDLNAAADLLKERLDEVATLDLKIDKKSQAGLESAISKINQQLVEMEKIDFSVKLDRASLIKARDEMLAELDQKIQLQVEVDRQAANAIRQRIVDQLKAIPINTKLDQASVTKVMREIEGYLDQIEDLRAVITPEMDERAKAQVNRQIDDIKDKIDDLKAQIKPDVSMPFWANAWKTLALLTRDRFVHLYTKVNEASLAAATAAINRLSGARVVTNMVKELGESLGNLDRSAPKIAGIAAGIFALGGAATNAVGSVLSLAGSLISMAPAALALPGLLGGMALGALAAGIAFKDFGKYVPELKTDWNNLKSTISDNFWDKAATPMRDMVRTLFPQFSAGMSMIGTKTGEFFGKFANSLTGALDGRLDGMFANLGKSIDIAGNSTGSLANIIAILGDLGSQYLPRLAQWFVDITKQFSDFLTKSEKTGALKEWVDNGITALGQLGSVLKSIGSIFLSLTEAATLGGGGTLAGLSTTLAGVAEVAKDPVFQGQLAEFFRSTSEAMSLIGERAGPALQAFLSNLLTTFSNVLPTIGATLGIALDAVATALADPALSAGLSSMFQGLKEGVAAIAPVFSTLGPVLGMLAQTIGAVLSALGPVIAAVLSALIPALETLLPVLQPIIEMLGGILTQALTALTPLFTTLVTLIAALLPPIAALIEPLFNLVMAILQPLLDIITEVVTAAMPPLTAAFTRLSESLQPVIEILTVVVGFLMDMLGPAIKFVAEMLMNTLIVAFELIATVFEVVVGVVMGIWNTWSALFRGDWEGVWNGIKQIWGSVWDGIVSIFKTIWDQIQRFWGQASSMFTDRWESVWNGIKSFFSGIWKAISSAFSAALGAVRSLWDSNLNTIQTLWSTCWNAVRNFLSSAWQAIQTAIGTGITNAIQFFRDMPNRILSALGNLGNLLLGVGEDIINGLIRGIRNMFGDVENVLGNLTSMLPDWKGPESLDKVLLVRAGELVIGGFIRGMESQYDAVRRSLRGLTSDVAGMTVDGPQIGGVNTPNMANQIAGALSATGTEGPVVKVLNYYAAAGSSLDGEEDLFAAAGRARMVW
ncbi:hypothetical protein [Micromonospora sp. CB01531]|uniref:hypothetical protein n=1 Tax=Micromonospora sp. CB01531 TaxID=1718947 RepID=UPI00093FF16B|nr:hypothetical protein [Micromonospora sp. CB01531]OKI45114.1 hypothetical protein A6A27_11900 [Micromonospora sp. CB01531]